MATTKRARKKAAGPVEPNPFAGGAAMPDATFKPGISVTPQGDVYRYEFSAGSWMAIWVENIKETKLGILNAPPKPGDVTPEILTYLQSAHQFTPNGLAARSAMAFCKTAQEYNQNSVFEGWLSARKTYSLNPHHYLEPEEPAPYYWPVNYQYVYRKIAADDSLQDELPPVYSWHLRLKQ